MEKTAVEWFAGEIKGGKLITNQKFKDLLEQAKEMEEQNLNTVHKIGMELREYEIFEWLKCQDYDFLVEEIIKSE